MSKRQACPRCGDYAARAQVERSGCCSVCELNELEEEQRDKFSDFMAHDEETRWRLLWEAAGEPT